MCVWIAQCSQDIEQACRVLEQLAQAAGPAHMSTTSRTGRRICIGIVPSFPLSILPGSCWWHCLVGRCRRRLVGSWCLVPGPVTIFPVAVKAVACNNDSSLPHILLLPGTTCGTGPR
jgi:hypothetical protein